MLHKKACNLHTSNTYATVQKQRAIKRYAVTDRKFCPQHTGSTVITKCIVHKTVYDLCKYTFSAHKNARN